MRESGVVFGSEIMKNAKRRSAPLSSRCSGIVRGSCTTRARAKSRAANVARNESVTSAREARCTTNRPAQTMRKAKTSALPHWPGDTQTSAPAASIATIPKFVGLKRCFPFQRRRNLLAMVTAAAAAARRGDDVRSKRQSERPEISALQGSKAGRRKRREKASCAASAVPRRRIARETVTSKERAAIP